MNHGSHGGGSGNSTMETSKCEMSMLWNWQTIDSCFLAEGWRVTNRGMFAATCVGVALLGTSYEALRRVCREYDMFLSRQLAQAPGYTDADVADYSSAGGHGKGMGPWVVYSYNHGPRRATPFQQLVRTVLHVIATGVGYLLMLIIMTFNGYAFFSILIGTGIGKFLCDWMTVGQ